MADEPAQPAQEKPKGKDPVTVSYGEDERIRRDLEAAQINRIMESRNDAEVAAFNELNHKIREWNGIYMQNAKESMFGLMVMTVLRPFMVPSQPDYKDLDRIDADGAKIWAQKGYKEKYGVPPPGAGSTS